MQMTVCKSTFQTNVLDNERQHWAPVAAQQIVHIERTAISLACEVHYQQSKLLNSINQAWNQCNSSKRKLFF